MTITAAADGSALGNPGPAGWCWYVDDACWGAGGWKHATNNQGELKAVLELFRATAHLDEDLLVLCDSQYVINAVTKWMRGWKAKGWRKADGKPVMNLDLLQELDAALAGRKYRFEWVRGHVGHPLNEAADSRARAVAEAFQGGRAVPAGPGWTKEAASAPSREAAPRSRTAARQPASEPSGAGRTPHAEERPAAREAARRPARAGAAARAEANQDDQPSLFSFDDAAAAGRTVSLALSGDEFARLEERARRAGTTVEELLRGLI